MDGDFVYNINFLLLVILYVKCNVQRVIFMYGLRPLVEVCSKVALFCTSSIITNHSVQYIVYVCMPLQLLLLNCSISL